MGCAAEELTAGLEGTGGFFLEETAMPGPASTFREIHRLRRHAQDLQDQLDRFPRQLKAHQTKVTRLEGEVREGHDAIKKLKLNVHEKEGTLKDQHAQIAKYQKQLSEVTSKKEYDALQAEIGSVRNACRRVEDDILQVLEDIDLKTAGLPQLEKTLAQGKEEYAAIERDANSRRVSLTEQLKETLAQLQDVEAHVPRDLVSNYKRAVASKGADAIAPVHDRICMACQTEITMQAYTELVQDFFVICKACGRILYLPQTATVAGKREE
jgi:predicted  nucleic acid-binding Zn-ribbon protein